MFIPSIAPVICAMYLTEQERRSREEQEKRNKEENTTPTKKEEVKKGITINEIRKTLNLNWKTRTMRDLKKQELYWYERIINILNDAELNEPLKGWIIYNLDELITEILKNENTRKN